VTIVPLLPINMVLQYTCNPEDTPSRRHNIPLRTILAISSWLSESSVRRLWRPFSPYAFKWQKYLDVSFANEEHPYIIPYQTPDFWTGTWDSQNTQNIWNAKAINENLTGVEFIDSTLTIEVYAVTRQRILQTGTTNGRATTAYPLYSVSPINYTTHNALRRHAT
jgi:hypothetical protein